MSKTGAGHQARLARAVGIWYLQTMAEDLTADEILPLVARLSPQERARLLRLLKVRPMAADAYAAKPPTDNEFGSDEDPLEWESGGWEDVG